MTPATDTPIETLPSFLAAGGSDAAERLACTVDTNIYLFIIMNIKSTTNA